jgi:predicted enzyme related to lactoylglutathione lyase
VVVLDSPDARALADFYQRLLGWSVRDDEPEWVVLQAPQGGTTLSF